MDEPEDELFQAQRLIDAQRMRLDGISGYSLEDFETGMKNAIAQGAQESLPPSGVK